MKKSFLIASVATVLALLMSGMPVHAQSDGGGALMTDSHIQRIKQNCQGAARTIQQIHVNDGPLRVNRGQVYDLVSSKLMAPFNSRLILNKYDASAFVKITAQYDKTMASFREDYKKYDDQMSTVLGIDCVKQPVSFYDAVGQARKLRTAVNNDTVKLHALITEYADTFSDFRTRFLSGQLTGDGS